MERWLPIKGYPNYEVSNYGRIKSLKHNKVLKPYDNGRGYDLVDLFLESKRTTKKVHRIVADTFFDGDHENYEVNHIDGNKKNNFIGNLEWCTKSENLRHAYAIGLKQTPKYHPKQRKVRIVENGETFATLNECARHIRGQSCHIAACLDGRRKTHKGYHFEEVV